MHLSRTPAEAAAIAAVTSPDSPRADDGEPSEPDPLLYVPVRPCADGFSLRVFRSPLGARTAVAFTTERLLREVFGPDQPSIRLALPAVRALTAPLGVEHVSVDPQLTAPAVRPVSAFPG
jgi:hypothetical protein